MSAAGLATSVAQTVYSVNAVGYVNLAIPAGFSIIANPLVASANTIAALFPSVPENTTIYKFSAPNFSINSFEFGAWGNPAQTLVPGEGAFINAASAFTNTFVGEVSAGNLTNAIPQGFSIRSSQVPQAGLLTADLKYTPAEEDTVYRFNNASRSYSIHSFEFGSWTSEPNVRVGEGFFMKKSAAGTWNRTFSIGG